MAVHCFQSGSVKLDKFTDDAEIYIKDVVDASISDTIDAGWLKWGKGESLEWTLEYDEIMYVVEGVFSISTSEGAQTAEAGSFFFISKGQALTYSSDEGALLFYVTYPHWVEASQKAGRL
mgnify:CR=1 FL=1|jgi:ethanolamine utilization protein EutQ